MAHVRVQAEDVTLTNPTMVEGLPGVGLVGKIAADHLVEQREMTPYASVHCEGLPQVAVYGEGSHEVVPPVRLYADAEADLLVLQSDVPVSPSVAREFASCLTDWLVDNNVMPVYLSGLPAEKEGVPALWGVATGAAADKLDEPGIDPPDERGMISGPTGALLAAARDRDHGGIGFVVEANPQFPDPEAARVILTKGIAPLADIAVETDRLTEQAETIANARQELAKQMQQAQDEATRAEPVGMYQ